MIFLAPNEMEKKVANQYGFIKSLIFAFELPKQTLN